MGISVIVPVLNEEFSVEKTLTALAGLQAVSEVIVVDGGSQDKTCEIVKNFRKIPGLQLVQMKEAGRGRQLHEGTKHASSEIFWFVHADTLPAPDSDLQIIKHLDAGNVAGGNFEIVFDGERRWAKALTRLYPYLRIIGLVYGDSAIFVRREVYEKVGGFRDFPIFEDVDFFRRANENGHFVTIKPPVKTSSRRFEKRNFGWIFMSWMILQGLYWIGIPPRILAGYYLPIRK
jgi:rSAM/selenodomain-associated transferase 2